LSIFGKVGLKVT